MRVIVLLLTTALDGLIAKGHHLVTVSQLIALGVPLGCNHIAEESRRRAAGAKLGKGCLSRRTGDGRALSPVPEELSGRSSLAR
jgi:hypothetical protein